MSGPNTYTAREVHYPDSDGMPMADNTRQFRWIVTLQGGFDTLFKDDPGVFVAGDLLWYPIEGDNKTRVAPDAMVVFGRPKGDRGSYQQWKEDGIAPQVVFEVLSPSNSAAEMVKKLRFYERHGVEEMYTYDPDHNTLEGWIREGTVLQEIPNVDGWLSPRLRVRFELKEGDLRIIRPDGTEFLSFVDLYRRAEELEKRAQEAQRRLDAAQGQADAALQQADAARQRAEAERQRAEAERRQADEARARAARLADRLRSLGVDPKEVERDQQA